MEEKDSRNLLTTIGIDRQTNKLIDKLCKRYSLKKGEIVKLAFAYIDKACINPSEPPESAKAELAKVNKRQDDLIRFIRHFEENQLNPLVKASNSITVRFDTIVKTLCDAISSEINTSRQVVKQALDKVDTIFGEQKRATTDVSNRLNVLSQYQKSSIEQLMNLLDLYAELAACGLTDGKKKERLRTEITNLLNQQP